MFLKNIAQKVATKAAAGVQQAATKAAAGVQQAATEAAAGVQQAATEAAAGVQQAASAAAGVQQAATEVAAGVQQAATEVAAGVQQAAVTDVSKNTAAPGGNVPVAAPTIPSTSTKQVPMDDPEAIQKAIKTSHGGLTAIGSMLFCLYVMKGLILVFQKEQEALHQQFDLYMQNPPAEDDDADGEGGGKPRMRMVPYSLSRMASIPYQAILHSYTQLVFVVGIFFLTHTFFYSDKHGLLASFYKPTIHMLRFAFLFFLVTMALNILIRVRSRVLRMDSVTPFQRSRMVREQKGIFMTICVGMVMMLMIVLRS